MEINYNHLKGKTAVITGGGGVICSTIAMGFAKAGVQTVLLDINEEQAKIEAKKIEAETGVKSVGLKADVLNKASLIEVKETILKEFKSIDILVNGAGGNSPKATTKVEEIASSTSDLEGSFFDLDSDGFDWVFALNFKGTLLPTLVFAEDMVKKGEGSVLNISSMNAFSPLTKIPAYSAAKSSINNFTQWLAVHFAKTGVRVNAIAPGFFLTNQNRFLLVDEKTGDMTPRGQKIIRNTPMGRYGDVDELIGTSVFLSSDMAKFITGVIIPIDGGYSAFGGI
jgi:NAD(P)-dependent dehydrogenase (short-subunit alcohol dehydrogenase family)